MGLLDRLFAPKPCPACQVNTILQATLEEEIGYLRARIETLETHRTMAQEKSEAEKQELHDTLFRVARLTPQARPVEQEAPGEMKKMDGGSRNWNRVRSQLEQAHRLPDDEKLARWVKQNAKAEAEIPELKKALEDKQVIGDKELQQDIAELES